MLCGFQPIHTRQLHIHKNDVETLPGGNSQRFLARFGDLHGAALTLEHRHRHLLIDQVVLYQQHLAAFAGRIRLRQSYSGLLSFHLDRFQWQLYPEPATQARAALDTQCTAHGLCQPVTDSQSEPGTAIAPRCRGVALAEGFEQPGLLVYFNARPGITH